MRSINRAVFQYQQLNRAGRCNQCRCQILRRWRLEILSAYWLRSSEHPVHSSQQLPPRPAALFVLRLQRRTAPLCPFKRNLPHNRHHQNHLPTRSECLPGRPAMCSRIRPSFFQGTIFPIHSIFIHSNASNRNFPRLLILNECRRACSTPPSP